MKGFSIVPAELCAEGKERTTISGIGRGMGCNAKGDIKGNKKKGRGRNGGRQ
jgi:hypothetical protein